MFISHSEELPKSLHRLKAYIIQPTVFSHFPLTYPTPATGPLPHTWNLHLFQGLSACYFLCWNSLLLEIYMVCFSPFSSISYISFDIHSLNCPHDHFVYVYCLIVYVCVCVSLFQYQNMNSMRIDILSNLVLMVRQLLRWLPLIPTFLFSCPVELPFLKCKLDLVTCF